MDENLPDRYVGVVQFRDGGRQFDWSVTNVCKLQDFVDALHIHREVAQAFVVPPSYPHRENITWATIKVADLDRAGCGASILYPTTWTQT
jgi:hypothetical protein